jgi:curved DNA-binding protein
MFGEDGDTDLFDLLFGHHRGQRRARKTYMVHGEDLEAETTLSLEEAYHGTTRLMKIGDQTIRVTIHPGIEDEHVLKVPGKGAAGMNGGANGDLYLRVKITSHPDFQRKGNDLYCDLPVELYTAVLGGKTKIKTLKGTVRLAIPKETPNSKVLVLRGLGMPIYGKKNEFGNLYAKILIQLPDHLGKEEIDLFKKLAALQKTGHAA